MSLEINCPKCPGTLEHIQHGHVEAEGCNNCRGLLLKPESVNEVMLYSMIETYLDIGNPGVGRQYDRIGDIRCPHCKLDMEKQEDPEQIHIWTEKCPGCGRIFFDAGELTDLKYNTFSDFLLDLLKGHRHQDSQ